MKNKKVILVAGSVFPEASATGNICYQVAKELSKKYDIHIISMLNRYVKNKEIVTKEGIRISIVRNFWFSLRQRFAGRNNRIGLNIIRAIDKIFTLLFLPKNTWWYARKVEKIIRKESKRYPEIDIISFSEPFEAHWGVLKAKRKGCNFNWISIFADSFAVSTNKKNMFLSLKKMLDMERSILKNSRCTFVTPEIYNSRTDLYAGYEEKVSPLPYLIKDNVVEHSGELNGEKTRMIYAGRFYKDIRPPEPLMDFFMSLNMHNAVLDLFTGGECENTVRRYSESSGGSIRLNGMITQDQLFLEYGKSDFLFNLENNVKEYKPSKQYEYIGTGKPIISLYYFEPDKELSRYPMALQINANNWRDSIDEARSFIQAYKGKVMKREDIFAIYTGNTLKHVIHLIENCLK